MSAEYGMEHLQDFTNVLQSSAIKNRIYLVTGRDVNMHASGPYLKMWTDLDGNILQALEGYDEHEVLLFTIFFKGVPRIKVFNGLSQLALCGILNNGGDAAANHPLMQQAFRDYRSHIRNRAQRK